MVNYYKTIDNRVQQIECIEPGCWINMQNPSRQEVEDIIEALGVDAGFVNSGLDEEEASRVEVEEGQTLIVVDVPSSQKENEAVIYSTIPMAVIITKENIITVCLKETSVIKEFAADMVKNVETRYKTSFVLRLFLKIATRYLQYLKQIDKMSSYMEKQLHQSMRNKELFKLLDLEKSLVYFSTSLKANEVTFEKIQRGRILKLYEEDQDLLEDVLIEIKQAIEMSNIYSNILSGMMDAFASIISNNLNIVMKVLTSITILMAVPTMVASFYGMNVTGLPLSQYYFFPIIIALVITGFVALMLHKKGML